MLPDLHTLYLHDDLQIYVYTKRTSHSARFENRLIGEIANRKSGADIGEKIHLFAILDEFRKAPERRIDGRVAGILLKGKFRDVGIGRAHKTTDRKSTRLNSSH